MFVLWVGVEVVVESATIYDDACALFVLLSGFEDFACFLEEESRDEQDELACACIASVCHELFVCFAMYGEYVRLNAEVFGGAEECDDLVFGFFGSFDDAFDLFCDACFGASALSGCDPRFDDQVSGCAPCGGEELLGKSFDGGGDVFLSLYLVDFADAKDGGLGLQDGLKCILWRREPPVRECGCGLFLHLFFCLGVAWFGWGWFFAALECEEEE